MMKLFYWILIMISIIISASFLILLERKILSLIHLRKGPNISFYKGYLNSLSDALKLFMKNFFYPQMSNFSMYYLSPLMMLFISVMVWLYYPFGGGLFFIELNIIYFMVMMGLSIFPFIFCSWSSNSKYSMLGCVRSIAQILSYEISLFLILFSISQCVESFSLMNYTIFQKSSMNIVFTYISFILIFLNLLIEMNRTPFDLSESESELVSGFNTEIGGGLFIFIFLSEYLNMMLASSLMFIMFFYMKWGLSFFNMGLVMFFIILRGSLPRVRYDKLMFFSWKKILPLSLCTLIFLLSMKMFLSKSKYTFSFGLILVHKNLLIPLMWQKNA